ncbi:FMN-binding negative transcriptional regulator [Aliivibrio fischeri]|uniref:FMN-binding negative transcriptional regulator n=1 Tax=Aliivibrio fischeri TaxID=668 RepID=UPI00084C9FF9|nr:FMN-binding negative transcriptional regulator [Aliivibrio fischeri]OED52270.1 transcriptional regulator [Aliivibrio fischeri]
MFIPRNMEMKDHNLICNFIKNNNFGVLTSSDLTATHIPFVLKSDEGNKGTLYGHLAKANKHWKQFQNQRVLIVFNGPHAYISPTWYLYKPAVPTWNYAAVHCYGIVEIIDGEGVNEVMDDTILAHEPELLLNSDIMSTEYQAKLKNAIVAFKIVIDDYQDVEKLGQQRKIEDQHGVHLALKESKYSGANELAEYMEKRDLGIGS